MPKEFMDYPIKAFDGLYYIEVDTWQNARILQELWNTDSKLYKIAFAQFPEHKDYGEFKNGLVYVWLRIIL